MYPANLFIGIHSIRKY